MSIEFGYDMEAQAAIDTAVNEGMGQPIPSPIERTSETSSIPTMTIFVAPREASTLVVQEGPNPIVDEQLDIDVNRSAWEGFGHEYFEPVTLTPGVTVKSGVS